MPLTPRLPPPPPLKLVPPAPPKTPLLQLYLLNKSGDLSDEEVAKQLGITARGWRIRAGKLSDRIVLTLGTLDLISIGELTRAEAAVRLDRDVRTVNALMLSYGIGKPISSDVVRRQAAKLKGPLHTKFAIDFIEGTLNLKQAAKGAQLSERQVRRDVEELLEKHYDMPWKDLKSVTAPNRAGLADEMRLKEDIDGRRNLVQAVLFSGKHSLKAVAASVVAAKQTIKRAKSVRKLLKPKEYDGRPAGPKGPETDREGCE